MNIKKTYRVLGADGVQAKFEVSIGGFIQIEFVKTLCKMRAPLSEVKVERYNSTALGDCYEVTCCSPKVDKFWQLKISEADGKELLQYINGVNDAISEL